MGNGKLRQAALVLGEGPTEFFYFKSLQDVFKTLTIKPDYPKHTSINELDKKIAAGVDMGYNRIFCIIDMDTKDKEPERSQYQTLKSKYAAPIKKPRKGILCKVDFFESHRCTELFFLYYFQYTSRQYDNQASLIQDINRHVEYKKTKAFFTKGLHHYFEQKGGSLQNAMSNANRSLKEKETSNREYTYSELGRLFKELQKLEV